jgi:protein HIRA/HIR1
MQSDDRTVKIWRTTDFALEKTIAQPFHNSPSTTYFRRPSWSPDGSHIAAANAMNGPVSTVVIIDRGTWNSDISLIGHESPVEVTSFNPRLFRATSSGTANGEAGQQWISIIACAGQDRVLSIWNTLNPRPLVITQDIAEKSISDLCWSPEGTSLFISSYDGSITVCIFEEGDLGKPLPLEENVQFLARYGHDRHGILLPESPAQLELEKKSKEKEADAPARMMAAVMGSARTPVQESPITSKPSVPSSLPKPPAPIAGIMKIDCDLHLVTEPQVIQQKVTITKDGKKRVAPMFLGSSANAPVASSMPESKLLPAQSMTSESTRTLDLSTPSAALPRGGMPTMIIGNKRKHDDVEDETRANQPNGAPKETQAVPAVLRPAIISPATGVSQIRLGVPRVMSHFDYVMGNDSGLLLEARNGSGQTNPSRITLSKGKQILWLDYIPHAALLMTGNDLGYAAACEDGSLITWTKTGRRLLPPIILESQPCFLESQGQFLLCITSVGMMHIW